MARPINESTTLLDVVVSNADAQTLRDLADGTLAMLVLVMLHLRDRYPADYDAWHAQLQRDGMSLDLDADRRRES